eukprot:scaffold1.g5349.t1
MEESPVMRTKSWLLDSPARKRSGHRSEPFFIGVAGGTASGKTTVCDLISQRLQEQSVVMLSQARGCCSAPQQMGEDSFYRELAEEELDNVKTYNFDNPEAFDEGAMLDCLKALKARRACSMALHSNLQPYDVPVYDFATHRRSMETRRVMPAEVVVLEGILVLHMEKIRNMLNMKIFVDTDDDVRLARRITRDVSMRGRDVEGVIEQYTKSVKPAFDQYVAPSRKYADVIIPWARGDNVVAIDLITQHIRMKLQQHDLRRIYPNLEVIPSNFQIRGMHTIIRDAATSKPDFVFYADRLLRLVVEAGLGHLPFRERTVVTPTGAQYVGVDFAKKLCGVSIIRSGESMENALRACCKGIKIGKILVHREKVWAALSMSRTSTGDRGSVAPRPTSDGPVNVVVAAAAALAGRPSSSGVAGGGGLTGTPPRPHSRTFSGGDEVAPDGSGVRRPSVTGSGRLQEQEIIYEKLPCDIAERYVLLMDPILGTGNSAARAIQVLLEKGVEEGKILFLTLIAAPEGIHRICRQFPRLKVITSEIDECMQDLHVVPGVGEFGDRYFCGDE